MTSPLYLSTREVAELLGYSETHILELAARDKNPLPSFAIPSESGLKISRRFRRDELEAWLEAHRVRVAEVVQLRETG